MNITTQSATYGSITKFSSDHFVASAHSVLIGGITCTVHAEFSTLSRAENFLIDMEINAYRFISPNIVIG